MRLPWQVGLPQTLLCQVGGAVLLNRDMQKGEKKISF